MLASTVTASARAQPGQHGARRGGGHRLPQLPPGQQLGVDRRDLRQHRLDLLAPGQAAHAPPPPAPRAHTSTAPDQPPAGRSRHTGRAVRRSAQRQPGLAAAPGLLHQRPGQHLLHVAQPRRQRDAVAPAAPASTTAKIVLVYIHHTRVSRDLARQSTTLDRACRREQLGQPLDRQPMRPRRLATIGPRPRQRDLTTDTAGAHEHRVPGPTLDEQHLQPLPDQRMERMRDDNKTQIVTGRRGTMPPPSEFLVGAVCHWPWECARAEPEWVPGAARAVHPHRHLGPVLGRQGDLPVDPSRPATRVALGHLAHADQRVRPGLRNNTGRPVARCLSCGRPFSTGPRSEPRGPVSEHVALQ